MHCKVAVSVTYSCCFVPISSSRLWYSAICSLFEKKLFICLTFRLENIIVVQQYKNSSTQQTRQDSEAVEHFEHWTLCSLETNYENTRYLVVCRTGRLCFPAIWPSPTVRHYVVTVSSFCPPATNGTWSVDQPMSPSKHCIELLCANKQTYSLWYGYIRLDKLTANLSRARLRHKSWPAL